MSLRDDIRDSDETVVEGDQNLTREQREVSIVGTASETDFHIHASIPSVVRKLLLHEPFEPTFVYAVADGGVKQVNGSKLEEQYEDGEIEAIVQVDGTIPVGSVSVSSPRNNDHFSRLVSPQEKDR